MPAPEPFLFKVDGTLGDRGFLGLTPQDPFAAEFNIAIACSEIDGALFPQGFSVELDLNVNDLGQTPTTWFEGFEGGLGKFTPQNNDAGLPGMTHIEALMNSDGWRCQYQRSGLGQLGFLRPERGAELLPDQQPGASRSGVLAARRRGRAAVARRRTGQVRNEVDVLRGFLRHSRRRRSRRRCRPSSRLALPIPSTWGSACPGCPSGTRFLWPITASSPTRTAGRPTEAWSRSRSPMQRATRRAIG